MRSRAVKFGGRKNFLRIAKNEGPHPHYWKWDEHPAHKSKGDSSQATPPYIPL